MKKTVLLAVLYCLPLALAAQNKIDNSKSSLSSGSSSSGSSSSSSSSSSSDDDDDSFGAVLAGLFIDAVLFVTWQTTVGSPQHEPHLADNALTHYPFEYPAAGNYVRPVFSNDTTYQQYADAFRFEIKDKFLYSYSSLYGNQLSAKIRPWRYFYFSTDYYLLHERQEAQGTSDNLSLFYFNFAYDRIRLPRFNLGWTVGASYVPDVDRGGFSVGLNGEYFLQKKLSFMVGGKWSWVNYQPVHVYEAEARLHKKNLYLTAGFEHLRIAGPKYNFVTLGAGIYF